MKKDNKVKKKDDKKLEELKKLKKESIELLKPVFVKYNATSIEKGILKEEVIADVKDNKEAGKMFKFLKSLDVIKKNKNKYYYNEKEESSEVTMEKNTIIDNLLIIIIVILAIATIMTYAYKLIFNTNKVENDDVSFKMSNTWSVLYDYEADYGWDYYRYVSTTPGSTNIESADENTVIDYSNYPARIHVYYSVSTINDAEGLKSDLDTYIGNEIKPTNYEVNTSKSKTGYDVVSAKIEYAEDGKVEYIYYILNDDKIAYVDAFSYSVKDETALEKGSKVIIDSFQWK